MGEDSEGDSVYQRLDVLVPQLQLAIGVFLGESNFWKLAKSYQVFLIK